MELPSKIREYYLLCAIKLGTRRLPITPENMHVAKVMGKRHFDAFFNVVRGDVVAKENVIGGSVTVYTPTRILIV
jgi:hypothetical protein